MDASADQRHSVAPTDCQRAHVGDDDGIANVWRDEYRDPEQALAGFAARIRVQHVARVTVLRHADHALHLGCH
jgi:hypothetical protein